MNKLMSISRVIMVLIIIIFAVGQSSCKKIPDSSPVIITAALPLTGGAAEYGKTQQKGIILALKDIREKYGKELIKVVYKDTKVEPKLAVNAVQQSIATDDCQVVFSISTTEVLALAPICNRSKVVLLSPIASGDSISNAGPYVFRLAPSDSFQGEVMAITIYNLGIKKVGVLFTNDAFGMGLSNKFQEAFKKLGGVITAIESCNPNETDLRTQLTKIKDSNPEAVYYALKPAEVVPALQQTKELGLQVKIFGGDTFSDKSVYTVAPSSAQGAIFALPAKPDNPEFKKFATEFEKKYGIPPDINAAAAYDAVMLVAKAVKEGNLTGPAIKKYFDIMPEDVGASGLIKWDGNGDVVSKKYAVYIVEGQQYVPYH